MKKYTILFCVLLTQLSSLFAQTDSAKTATQSMSVAKQNKWPKPYYDIDSIERENIITNAEFVFEGVEKFSKGFGVDTPRYQYIICTVVEIKKVFKGNIASGTMVKMLRNTKGSMMNGGSIKKDSIGSIYFCKGTSELKKYLTNEIETDSIIKSSHEYKKYFTKDPDFCNNLLVLDEYPGIGFEHNRGLGLKFENKAGVYSYLRGHKGLNVPDYKEPVRVLPQTPCTNCVKKLTPAQMDSLRQANIKYNN